MRCLHYESVGRGRMQDALQQAEALNQHALQQIQAALRDTQRAIAYINAGKHQRPNRIDLCNQPQLAPQSGLGGHQAFLESFPSEERLSLERALGGFAQTVGRLAPSPSATPAAALQSSSGHGNPFANTHAAHSAKAGDSGGGMYARAVGGPFRRMDDAPLGAQTAPSSNSHGINGLGDSAKDPNGRLATWNGQRIVYIREEPCYKDSAGRWQKIWFLTQPQWNKEPDLPPSAYGAEVETAYGHLRTHGVFAGGKMPDVPPKRDWCKWQF